jgi:hypothetical protein
VQARGSGVNQDVVDGLTIAGAARNAHGYIGKQTVDITDVGQPVVDGNPGHIVCRRIRTIAARYA